MLHLLTAGESHGPACVAIIDGYLWVWEPESDDPFLYSGWGQVR